ELTKRNWRGVMFTPYICLCPCARVIPPTNSSAICTTYIARKSQTHSATGTLKLAELIILTSMVNSTEFFKTLVNSFSRRRRRQHKAQCESTGLEVKE